MNKVILIGRLTKDVASRETASGMMVARFSIAIDRPTKQGAEKQADYPTIMTFGKTAENCVRYLKKGRLVAVEGRIQTGSYEKDSQKYYTTEVVAERVKFLEWESNGEQKPAKEEPVPEGFTEIEEDIPF